LLRSLSSSLTSMRIIVRTRAVVIQPRAVRVCGAVRRYIRSGVTPYVARAGMGVRVRSGAIAVA